LKKSLIILITLTLIILLIAGCSQSIETPEENETPEISEEEKLEQLRLERENLEKDRKEAMGEFYIPLPALNEEKELKTVKAKALYLTGNVSGFKFNKEDIDYYAEYVKAISNQTQEKPDTSRLNEINKLEKALGIAKASEINSVVIDIKNDHGYITWNSNLEIVNEIKSNQNPPFKNYEPLFEYLDQQGIYKIARVVAFKDLYFAKAKPDHAIQLISGGSYLDNNGESWVNPFDKYVWDYVIAVSKEAALRGFDEIQYDYVRFPDNSAHYNLITKFPGRNDRDKDQGIEDFLAYAREELSPYNVHLSADVFGFITHSWDDSPDDIGQTWRKVANQVDYICPMIYPSHYGQGLYGYDIPDRHPYEIAKITIKEAIERNAAQENPGVIRPWLQGFTASWIKGNIKYDAKAISDQIVASYELGVEEYIIWNPVNNYDPLTFFYHDRVDKTSESKDEDRLGRTPRVTLERFLKAQRFNRFTHLYLLTLIEDRPIDYDQFVMDIKNRDINLKSYDIKSIKENEDQSYDAIVDISYSFNEDSIKDESVKYEIIKENEVFKVRPYVINIEQ